MFILLFCFSLPSAILLSWSSRVATNSPDATTKHPDILFWLACESLRANSPLRSFRYLDHVLHTMVFNTRIVPIAAGAALFAGLAQAATSVTITYCASINTGSGSGSECLDASSASASLLLVLTLLKIPVYINPTDCAMTSASMTMPSLLYRTKIAGAATTYLPSQRR